MDGMRQLDIPFFHDPVHLLEVLKFFDCCLDELRYDLYPVRIFSNKAHGCGRCFPLTISMVLEKGVKIFQYSQNPARRTWCSYVQVEFQ